MDTDGALSRSMEDYLEVIYNLKVRSDVARVKDIAREMDVKMPSVTGAIRSLVEKGLVKHEPYECVELTDEGLRRASEVAHRHSAIKAFLIDVLGLHEDDAEREACGIEHAINADTLDRLLKFVESTRPSENGRRRRMGWGRIQRTAATTTLNQASPGTKGRIAFVAGKGPIRRRMIEMGLTPDTPFEVVRTAPLGDPIEIKIRGYLLSLRKSEASHIEIEVE